MKIDLDLRVLKDPEPVKYEIISRWWIVRAFKKLFGIKNRIDSGWKYTVKLN